MGEAAAAGLGEIPAPPPAPPPAKPDSTKLLNEANVAAAEIGAWLKAQG